MSKDVFISYSRKDYVDGNNVVIPNNIILKVKEALTENNISFWFDEDGIYSGDSFAPIIAKNIRDSVVFLFISTSNSNSSDWTSAEIATAHSYGKKIIPFRYDESHYNDSVILHIAHLDHIEYHKNPEKAITRLIESIKKYIKDEKAKEARLLEEKTVKELAALEKAKKEKDLAQIRSRMESVRKERETILSKLKSLEESANQVKSELEMVDSGYRDLQAKEAALLDNDFDRRLKEAISDPSSNLKADTAEITSIKDLLKKGGPIRKISIITFLIILLETLCIIILCIFLQKKINIEPISTTELDICNVWTREEIEYLDTHDVWIREEMENIPGLTGIWDMLNEYKIEDISQQADLSGSYKFNQLIIYAKEITSRGGCFIGKKYCTREDDFEISYNRYNRVLKSKIIELETAEMEQEVFSDARPMETRSQVEEI